MKRKVIIFITSDYLMYTTVNLTQPSNNPYELVAQN